jgi:pyrroline-5-carboxylate reductase
LRSLKREFGILAEADLQEALARAHLLIIAVRPDSVADLLNTLRHTLSKQGANRRRSPVVACSLAAGIPLIKLRAKLPLPWSRAMPSPVCRTGRGLTAVTFEERFPKRPRADVVRLFREVGMVLEIPEIRFDVFTATFSCSHGYHALATLVRAATRLGLDRKTALQAAAHALADGIVSWREGDGSLEELIQEAATPGGIAASVMRTMEAAGYARVIEGGLRAGVAQARRNSEGSA